ncbi:hypothetical protein GCM10017767_28080 [Halomonas urumqiensis]|nr:hypothetical protein GCM10017767_28080 [Halomonas urumqiensis]
MGEEHCSERAGHGWPAPVLQTKRDAREKQGIGSAQGWVHSASSQACRRVSAEAKQPYHRLRGHEATTRMTGSSADSA